MDFINAYEEHLRDSEDRYGSNTALRSVAAERLERNCSEPCGGWFVTNYDSIERCPCCPDEGEPEL